MLQCLEIYFSVVTGKLQNAFDLRPVYQVSVNFREIKWLDAEHITCRKQFPLPDIPDDKSKHTAKPVQKFFTPLLVAVQQNFRVCLVAENMTFGNQLLFQLLIVIDLTIEGNDHTFILIEHRLVPGIQINDGKPAEPHGHIIIDKLTGSVGSPVNNPVHHIGKDGSAFRKSSCKSADSTHVRDSFQFLLRACREMSSPWN